MKNSEGPPLKFLYISLSALFIIIVFSRFVENPIFVFCQNMLFCAFAMYALSYFIESAVNTTLVALILTRILIPQNLITSFILKIFIMIILIILIIVGSRKISI